MQKRNLPSFYAWQVFRIISRLGFIRNKPDTNYFFLEAVCGAFLAACLGCAFEAEGLLFDFGAAIKFLFKNKINVAHKLIGFTSRLKI
tara:strand:+ start:285 stop:548 length:264 start_codon:yes stop_codon:yes gene_type:complete